MDDETKQEVANDDKARHICEHPTCNEPLVDNQSIRVGLCPKHLREALENMGE